MRIKIIFITMTAILISGCGLNSKESQTKEKYFGADYLRCENRLNPAGIDVLKPRLSWIVESSQRGQKQKAYRILVASTKENLAKNEADLWDSQVVPSARTSQIYYEGKELKSEQDCYWKVEVWDKDNKPSGWSKPAVWSMGLLETNELNAEWIGFDGYLEQSRVSEGIRIAKWLWYPDFNDLSKAPSGKRHFRRKFEVSKSEISKAEFFIDVDNAFELFINEQRIGSERAWNKIFSYDVTRQIRKGENIIAVSGENVGVNPAGLIALLQIQYADGQVENIISDEQWLCSKEAPEMWKSVSFDDSAWRKSKVIGDYGIAPWGEVRQASLFLPPARYLRKNFSAEKPVKKARLYATALGIYKIYVNGKMISDDYFSPGWTDYTKRVYYRTYDVSHLLAKGKNAIGAILADGWYAGYVGYGGDRELYGKKTRFNCQLHIEYTDRTIDTIATDLSWKGSIGPILEADFLMGETYDARREMPGWATVNFDDSAWQTVQNGSEVNPKIQAAVSEPVVAFTKLEPQKITEPVLGKYVFEMGQNFAGVVQLKVTGKTGQKITLRFAERLNSDGTIYTQNLRGARATDTYICRGGGTEIWQPFFTFHGFQYVELTGIDYFPTKDTITGLALSSNTPVAGSFECSDEMINKLYSNIVWTQRMNFIDIPTDCPQRDERLGWTGDAQVYIRTACLNTDNQAFFTKWLTDLADAQREDGQFPKIAPVKFGANDGGPGWSDAGTICPWTIYQVYGNRQILEKNYEPMKRFVEFCKNRCSDNLMPPKEYHCYGDWLNVNDETPKDVIFTIYLACSTKFLAQTAKVLDKKTDAEYYDNLFEQIKKVFTRTYVDSNGLIKGDSQTAYVMAIANDLLDESQQKIAGDRLVEKIKSRNWHLSTGFIGTKDLMLVLAKIGRNDIAYRLLFNDTYPSWGFEIKNGATTIWERWNGSTAKDGFADPGMNSFAHYSFGAVYQWMCENIGGIKNASPGFNDIIIEPCPDKRLKYAKTTFNSINGKIETHWKLDNDKFILNVTIPANTTATLFLPAKSPSCVTESNKTIRKAPGVKFLRIENSYAVLNLQSGTYNFTSQIP